MTHDMLEDSPPWSTAGQAYKAAKLLPAEDYQACSKMNFSEKQHISPLMSTFTNQFIKLDAVICVLQGQGPWAGQF